MFLLSCDTTIYGGAADAYAIAGDSPELVADFPADYFRKASVASDFDTLFTYTGASLSTTVDSSGNIVWKNHNLALNSASPATQGITVESGADYTVEITGTGSITLSGAGSGSVTAGSPVEITASTTTLTCTIVGSPTTMWAYRSDLGGMDLNPETATTYLASSGSIVQGPRRHHHIYNGSSWVDQGIEIESEARTNLCTASNDFEDAFWGKGSTALLAASSTTGPDGVTNSATKLYDDNGGGASNAINVLDLTSEVATSSTYTLSVFAKESGTKWVYFNLRNYTTPASDSAAWFNLNTGAVGTKSANIDASNIEDYDNGWHRISITFTTDASDIYGQWQLGVCDADASADGTRDDTTSIFIYGAQFELGSTASSYIPTSGGTATRTAETLTIAGADTPANTTAMSFHMKGTINFADENAAAQQVFTRRYVGANDYITIDLDTDSGTGEINFNQAETGSGADTVASGVSVLTPGPAEAFNIAMRNVSTALNGALDGTSFTEDATPTALDDFTGTTLEIGYDFMGTIDTIREFGKDIADSGIETAST